jgi:pilus assembly protein CpaF
MFGNEVHPRQLQRRGLWRRRRRLHSHASPPRRYPPVRNKTPRPPISRGQAPAKAERQPIERACSEEYYDVKTTVFNALIDTIDLTQLSKLDPEAARGDSRNCHRNHRHQERGDVDR